MGDAQLPLRGKNWLGTLESRTAIAITLEKLSVQDLVTGRKVSSRVESLDFRFTT